MIFQYIAAFSCLLVAASAWINLKTYKPFTLDPCYGVTCPKPISHSECYQTYKPAGSCCESCACSNERGRTFNIGQEYIMHKYGYCYECRCLEISGVKNALCFMRYCPQPRCPPHFRVKDPNGCCMKCGSSWKERTFPPLPTFPGMPFPGKPSPGGFPPAGDEAAKEKEAKSVK